MSLRMLETGIGAIQSGNRTEGARLLRIALKSGELTGQLSAIAYMWLAETTDDPQQKRQFYTQAVDADPANTDAKQRLAAMLAQNLPPMPSSNMAPPPISIPEAAYPPSGRTGNTGRLGAPQPSVDQIAAVIGGPNGPGSAFFVTQDGLLATTRYVVGGSERIMLELGQGRQFYGQVIRCFPDMDLAFIRTEVRLDYLLPISPYPQVRDETVLTVLAANGQQIRGKQRPSKRVMANHWFTTDVVKLADAGGSPVFDDQNYLVGMMTKNYSRASGYLFGVQIAAIRRALEVLGTELSGSERRNYCPSCGSLSRATANGYFFCEVCGSVAPQARNFNRYPQGDPYAEVSPVVCTHCGAQAGYYGGRCLRCGQAPGIR